MKTIQDELLVERNEDITNAVEEAIKAILPDWYSFGRDNDDFTNTVWSCIAALGETLQECGHPACIPFEDDAETICCLSGDRCEYCNKCNKEVLK